MSILWNGTKHNHWNKLGQKWNVNNFCEIIPYKADFFFCLRFTTRQDYFIHFVQSQSKGGTKTGDPLEIKALATKIPRHCAHFWYAF